MNKEYKQCWIAWLSFLASLLACAPRVHSQVADVLWQKAARTHEWSFPQDHGAHPGFETEWWYYTGHLYGEGMKPFHDKPRYGFQLTFFRRAHSPGQNAPVSFLAHAALTDIEKQSTVFSSRLADDVLRVGAASNHRLDLRLSDWFAEQIADTHVLKYSIPGAPTKIDVRLLADTSNTKPLLQGENGFSKKGDCEECASLYYSLPGLPLQGEIFRGKANERVHGIGWMDHEVMTNALRTDQVGWDWMWLTSSEGKRFTIFQLRSATGARFISGSVAHNGISRPLNGTEISLTPVGGVDAMWKSPATSASYPIAWRVSVPSESFSVIVKARVPACELGHTQRGNADAKQAEAPVYWEGPIASEDEKVIGYLEMTGYAGKVSV